MNHDPVDSVMFVESESSPLMPEVKIEEEHDNLESSDWQPPPKRDQKSRKKKQKQKIQKKRREPDDLDAEIAAMLTTPDGKITCTHCQKPILKPHYRHHVERLHLNLNAYTCDLCSKPFHRKSSLLCHMHIHLNVRPFACPRHCGKHFFSKTAMRLHVKFHHTRHNEFICEVCAMSYKQRYLLHEHIAAKHAGVRFKCTHATCTNEYHSQSALRKHIDSIHESVLVACEFCGDNFRTGFSLYQHKRLNHSGRRFPCTAGGCGKTFATASKLKTHTKIHTGTKDFVCHVCNASYHIKRNLGRHIQVVHKKSRFFCEIGGCQASLCNKDNYRAHMKKVHASLPTGEMEKMLDGIAKMKPVFLDDDDEYDQDGVTV
jgi:uncharacterized Zn-finger protein